jgi:2-(1,2-epoxy-1,2-dihydrophenyl)acetyl-CoA isomerase
MESEMTTQTLSPPELSTLQIEIDGQIGTLTLNRPDAFNAMSPEMILELGTVFAWFADQAPLRGLIVTGAGKAFCAGGDVSWFKEGVEDDSIDLPAHVRRGAEALHSAIVDLRRIPYPVIAAINGPAAGAGFSLALACDMRIASETAFFACAYGRIGASPDGGMTYFLPRVVGPSRALEILLNDPNMNAQDALAERLISEVTSPDELMDRAGAKAEKLAGKAPHYVKMAKRLCGVSVENSITEHLQLERHGIADSMATEDLRKGAIAFFSGETPEFSGR